VKVGDLVRFWDYDTGGGWLIGVVTDLVDKQYSEKLNCVPSATIIYSGGLQTVPLNSECIPEVLGEQG
jgi:hypothetical protein